MSWTVLKPVSVSAGRPMFTAQVRVSSKGKATIVLFLAGTMHDDIGAPEAAEVSIGDGDTAGCLRIASKVDGDFAFKNSAGGCKRLTLPMIPGVAEKQTPASACQIVEREGAGVVIVRLPLQDWEVAITPAARALAPAPVRTAPVRGVDGKVDALGYLRTKGHRIDSLAGGRLQIDGELHTPPQVLSKINVHRRNADLPELALADLWLG